MTKQEPAEGDAQGKGTPIETRLLRDIIVTIVLFCIAMLATTFVGTRRTMKSLSAALIQRVTDETETRVRQFFDPVAQQLRVAAGWQRAGLLDPDDPEALNRLFAPVMRSYPQISSIMVADSRGREHMLLRTGTSWRNRQTRRDVWGDEARWWEWTDHEQQIPPAERREKTDYDPRDRPWFEGAVGKARTDNPKLHWTTPYTFFTTKDPGITASLAVHVQPEGGAPIDHVIGFDVLLNDISKFTSGKASQVSEHGLVVVVEDETSEVVGLPRDARFEDDAARAAAVRTPLEDLGVAPLLDAGRAWSELKTGRDEPFRFRSGGAPWWGGVRRLDLGGGRHLRVGVVLPESDLLTGVGTTRLLILGVTLIVLLAAIWRAIVLARAVSDPIEDLVAESERIRHGDLEPGHPIESSLSEVRALAEAQDRMRVGLRALMKLERDLQVARQIQQNTFPSALPGLTGFEVAAWSEPAEETGGDTYDVIGLQGGWTRASLVAQEEGADRAVMLLADATGHGVGPALSVTQLRAMLRMALRMGGGLEQIAEHLNRQLCDDLPGSRFITAWLGMLDPDDQTLRTFSAGQGPLLHYRAATDEFEVLQADAPPFGILPTIPIDPNEPAQLAPGDIYVVFSDGIFEARDPDEELFGEERVMELIRAHRTEHPDEILAAVRAAVAVFARGRPADDDQTAVIIKRR